MPKRQVSALQFLFTYAPFMEAFFGTRPLSLLQGLQIVAVGVALMLVLEVEKRAARVWADRRPVARDAAPAEAQR